MLYIVFNWVLANVAKKAALRYIPLLFATFRGPDIQPLLIHISVAIELGQKRLWLPHG